MFILDYTMTYTILERILISSVLSTKVKELKDEDFIGNYMKIHLKNVVHISINFFSSKLMN